MLPPGATKTPPVGQGFLYELYEAGDGPPFYVGVTSRHLSDRLAQHVSFARHRRGKNPRLEARIRGLAERGGVLTMRVVSEHACGPELIVAERARIAALRATLGNSLLNLGPGGETAPAGRLVPVEERDRARLARRARQRDEGYRRNMSLACSRRRHDPALLHALLADFAAVNPAVPMREVCRRHSTEETHLLGLLAGAHNSLVVDPELLMAARAAQARRIALRTEVGAATAARLAQILRAYLGSRPGSSLAEAARAHGMKGRRLVEMVRRREHGIPDDLARAVQERMAEDARLRGRALGRRSRRVNRRLLRWLLTAYSRPGSLLTLAEIGRRLQVTQGAVSHAIAGKRGQLPLPRRLAAACRTRAYLARLASLRRGAVPR
ncbi:hypothetical protein J8J14_21495 [Roseomonas sp. SSH11]|uniref:GIY-YIG domain-containing protein n=1 Tax=Pararoseomonas baculiformis TaxID=2820812 RepID=A0ABS4AK11_9PROT|nr:hypothetical protein [Pararoseomonas baculiformis]MBP0447346.1 hypothetical protein [Pararoseomonas baculiformis]